MSATNMKPMAEIIVLNASIQWPSTKTREDAKIVVRKLSEQMDNIWCVEHGDVHRRSEKFTQLEKDVCQLQRVARIPTSRNPEKYVAFVMNLYNLLVRHAMLFNSRNGTTSKTSPLVVWSNDQRELRDIFNTIAYNVGGSVVTAIDLETILLKRRLGSIPQNYPTIIENFGYGLKVKLSILAGCASEYIESLKSDSGHSYCYSFRKLEPRVSFSLAASSMIGGNSDAIEVTKKLFTVTPDNLEKHFESMAREYCRNHVQVRLQNNNNRGERFACTVILSTFLESWYQFNFDGKSGDLEPVVDKVLLYLDDNHIRHIMNAQNHDQLRVELGNISKDISRDAQSREQQRVEPDDDSENTSRIPEPIARKTAMKPDKLRNPFSKMITISERDVLPATAGLIHQPSLGDDESLKLPTDRYLKKQESEVEQWDESQSIASYDTRAGPLAALYPNAMQKPSCDASTVFSCDQSLYTMQSESDASISVWSVKACSSTDAP